MYLKYSSRFDDADYGIYKISEDFDYKLCIKQMWYCDEEGAEYHITKDSFISTDADIYKIDVLTEDEVFLEQI
jgi:hypothetical protein